MSGGTFGQLWSAPVNGQVYAQPLLSPTGTLIVATENDKVYGLNPATGAQQWTNDLGTPWNPADIGCGDIAPSIGTTATPVIDPTTNTVYLTHKTYVSGSAAWFMDALDSSTGHERPRFPVRLGGTADNNAAISFLASNEQQRPGLLLMGGVVYAGFGGHCDVGPYQGWVFGVSTAGNITAKWVDTNGANGAGIWQSGVGLGSDGPGSILLTTGNGGAPTTPTPGTSPPASFGETVVRLHVQPDGSLKPVDFFAPFDAGQLDVFDGDFGSGALVGLPDAYFGTAAIPHLAVAVGKEGYVYLLNRDHLGGYDQGPGGGDDVVQRTGPRGGVWGRPAVWPGDGGYVYIPTSTGQNGGGLFDVYKYGLSGTETPALSLVATSPDVFGWGSGPPVITSDGTTSGSALVWTIWSTNRSGAGGQLRAYDPVPVNGQPVLRYSAPIGTATNYSIPGVGAGRLYAGTRDGKVLAFGSPVSQPLGGSGLSFPRTTIGASNPPTLTLTLTADRDLTLSSLASSSDQFTLGTASLPLPATLATGQKISVPVTFSPTQTGLLGGQVNAQTDAGEVSFALSGTGQSASAELQASTPLVSLGGTAVGGHLGGTATFTNVGATTLTINAVHLPGAPFTATGAPSAGDTLAPGDSITVELAFDPTKVGQFADAIELDTTGGDEQVGVSATAGLPGLLAFSADALDFGATPFGSSAGKTFTITNTGGTNVTITKSKPPFGGAFAPTTSLPEGTTIAPGQTLTEGVAFEPSALGPFTGTWEITGDDGSGLHEARLTGIGVAAAPPGGPGPVGDTGGSKPAGGNHVSKALIAPKIVPARSSTTAVRSVYITYTADAATTSRFALARRTGGRLQRHRCVAPTAHNGTARACTRFVSVAAFTHRDRVGTNRVRLTAHVPAAKLVPGIYRLRAVLTDAAGRRHTFYALLRVVGRRHTPATRSAR
ncbi:MAG TPA: choice-of-anchor D domain-containing protein [Solirubrobacteraceae bacterium]|nr:choice-of-anchor D domain-containing protein [Solirubrobacteraceae bacterium]